ncbi:hypothetical protein ACIA6D_34100 [Streptomyces cacaoi]|uniref:hypothetical protein n=1 Tax=Streptomyces cacaoi TaxID=1898 RepID=UPI003748712E
MRKRFKVLAIAAIFPLAGSAALATASQAGADPNSGTVLVTGKVADCDNGNSPVEVKVVAGQETRTDDSADVEDSSTYSVTFKKIDKGAGTKATATVSCEDDTYKKNFTIKRPPTVGSTTQKINLSPP